MMKHGMLRTLTLGATALALAVSAAPAQARSHHDDDYYWRDRYHRDYRPNYDRRGYGHGRGYYGGVVVAPAPVVVTQPYYPAQNAQRIVCRDNYNPLPTVIGGVAGGAIGSGIGRGSGRTAAIISGALIGGMVGNYYTSYDRNCTYQTFEATPVGQPVYWQAPQGNYDYTVTPTRDYNTNGRYCREYQAVGTVGGHREETYGTACRQPDGSWQVVN